MEGGAMSPKAATARLLFSRPLLLKAGVSLFISVSGFLCARIIIIAAVRRRRTERATASVNKSFGVDDRVDDTQVDVEDDGSLCSDRLISNCTDSDHIEHDLLIEDSQSLVNLQLLALSSVITNLRERELNLESRFLRYCELREQESELLEIGFSLLLEWDRLESLSREVSRIEEDVKFLAEFTEECRKALEEVGYTGRVEKLRLCSKLKKVKQRVEEGRIKLKEGRLKIEEKERELAESMKENNELREKLAAVEKSVEAEEKELVHLRWSNACLKHELTKNHGQENLEDTASSAIGGGGGGHHVTHPLKKVRQPKIMKKFKRWRGWIGGDD
ncbi:hypothetical protein MLD38_026057 [Melastoma candidum]|uniref:Uncharacterized protein n=1 Tax=Melastoma candidum TaxID=119954 RepID=A0ACB9NXE6_9MYRT|nr:hypothetical protein MLD38_026057 [Melastoma candidum]